MQSLMHDMVVDALAKTVEYRCIQLPAKFGDGIRHDFGEVGNEDKQGGESTEVPNSMIWDLGRVRPIHY
jgi:hypothetical protein